MRFKLIRQKLGITQTDLAEQLEKETKQLKTALLTMSERATKLTEEAARLYAPLDERLNRVILSMTEGAK